MPDTTLFLRSPTRSVAVLVALLLTVFIAAPVQAHSFDTVVIAPNDDPATRAEMKTAFLLASAERDSHENEESDGHLGGLDVYLTILDVAEVGALDTMRPHFVAVPLAASDSETVPATIAQTGAVLVPPLANDTPEAMEYLRRASDPALAPFSQRFFTLTGHLPGPIALATYVSARRMDGAVRKVGHVNDLEQLKALIAR
jgi:hypothetical protein